MSKGEGEERGIREGRTVGGVGNSKISDWVKGVILEGRVLSTPASYMAALAGPGQNQ
jgi:hypothetical protein